MHRLFVALRPPAEIRSLLLGLMGGVGGARWQEDAQLHLTLRFIGDVDGRTAEDIATALLGIRQPAIETALSGIGVFDRKGVIDTLWVGVSPAGDLAQLHRKIDNALVRLGLAPESRAYKPHITLARFNRKSADIAAFAALHGGLSSKPFTLNAFALYESRLGSERAIYEPVARYKLTTSPPSAPA